MSIINFLKKMLNLKKDIKKTENIEESPEIYDNIEGENNQETQIISIWDILKSIEHTQANHLVSVIPFDEWVSMNEIRRRIWDIFQIEYKNDRSLYPYLKTMVDLGLIETSNIGGKRKWRKKDLLIKKNEKKKSKEKIEQKIGLNEQKTN